MKVPKTDMPRSKNRLVLVGIVLVVFIIVANLLCELLVGMALWKIPLSFFPECDYSEGWGSGRYQDCKCEGKKITLFDTLSGDGIRMTVCVGRSTVTTNRPAVVNGQ